MYRDLIAHRRQILGDAEVRALDGGRRIEASGRRLYDPGDLEDSDLVDLAIKRHGLGHSVYGQLARHFEAVLSGLFDLAALKRDNRIFRRIEEVRAFELLIELRHTSVDARQGKRYRDRRLGDVRLVELQTAFDLVEARARIGEAEMVPAEN